MYSNDVENRLRTRGVADQRLRWSLALLALLPVIPFVVWGAAKMAVIAAG